MPRPAGRRGLIAWPSQVDARALEAPALAPRELAIRFTDTEKDFVSEASVYRLLNRAEFIPL